MHQLFRVGAPRGSWRRPPGRAQRQERKQGWTLPGFSPPHSPPDVKVMNRKDGFFGTCFGPAIMAVFVRKPKWDWFYSIVLNHFFWFSSVSDTPDDTEKRAWIVRKAASEGKRTSERFRFSGARLHIRNRGMKPILQTQFIAQCYLSPKMQKKKVWNNKVSYKPGNGQQECKFVRNWWKPSCKCPTNQVEAVV